MKYNPKILLIMLGTVITTGSVPFVNMFIIKYIINISEKHMGVGEALVLVTLFFIVAGIINILKSFFSNMLSPFLNDFRQNEKRMLYKQVIKNNYQEMESPQFWNLYQKAQLSVRKNYSGNEGLLHNLIDLGSSVMPFILAIISIKQFDFLIICIIIFFALIGNGMIFWADKKMGECEINLSQIKYRADIFMKLLLNVSSQEEVRVGNAFNILGKKHDNLMSYIISEEEKIYHKNYYVRVFQGILIAIQDVIIYSILIWRYENMQFDIAKWILLISAMSVITFKLTEISSIITQINSNCRLVAEYKSFIEKNNHTTGEKYIVENQGFPLIKLDNVSFHYNEDDCALKDIGFEVQKGEKIAIVGLNGAGKSTLIKIIIGLYHPNSGEVYYSGTNIKDIKPENLYEKCTCVFQDINIYPYTLLTNVTLKDIDNSDKNKVETLFDELSDEPFIGKLVKKERTVLSKEIDSEGVDLSGGQKQKVALARAFYKDTDIVILDEPTASLDPISEKIVFDKINRLAKDKTVIFVSHRILSTMFCDKIILVENGCIIEMGTHKELMSMNGKYAELYNLQARFMLANIQEESHEEVYNKA